MFLPPWVPANGKLMKASQSVKVPLSSHLTPAASTGHVLDGLSTGSLISIGKLCDDDCAAMFSKYHVHIIKNGNIIIKGKRNPNGLWNIPFAPKATTNSITTSAPSKLPSTAASIIRSKSTKSDLAAFLHGTFFSPVVSTFVRAVRQGHLTTWPGLTTDLILRHLRPSIATTRGHQRGQQQNLRSTKVRASSIPLSTSLDIAPSPVPDNCKTKLAFTSMIDTKSFFDLTLTKQEGFQRNRVAIIIRFLLRMITTRMLSFPLPCPIGEAGL